MKLLFYGACHANALNNIFAHFGPLGVSSELLHSFELIAKQSPFPYETIHKYDVVVFSPIFGRPGWNTAPLVRLCHERGIKTVAFPLIEWRGYFPGFVPAGRGRDFRYYPDLFANALEHGDFAAFEQFVVEEHSVTGVQQQVDHGIALLRRSEELGEAQISVSRIIERRFRDERVMLTPTHPGRALYVDIVRELEQLLGLRMDPSFYHGTYEPQNEAKDPLLPATIRALGLQFSDCEFRSHAFFGDKRTLTPRQWLRMYWFAARTAVTFEATTTTYIKRSPEFAEKLPPADRIKIRPGDTIIALETAPSYTANQRISVLGGSIRAAAGTEWFLYPPAWRRFDFRPAPSRKAA